MILGSHNSWSYLRPRKWWQRALAFTAKCQRKDIEEQYALGVRCFDLRIRFLHGIPHVVHNNFDYGMFIEHAHWMRWLNNRGDVAVRVVHDVRKAKDYTDDSVERFRRLCKVLKDDYRNIRFWCGRNLYNYGVDYGFAYHPACTEMYASVCSPHLVDDWLPWLYAYRNNAWIRRDEYKPDEILLIDFVDI